MSYKVTLPVVCAVILDGKHVLAVQKSSSQSYPGLWEFPGGKVELGETDKIALIREIEEELQLEITVDLKLKPVSFEEETRIIELRPYLCEIIMGTVQLTEHQAYRWLKVEELGELDWAPADIPMVDQVAGILRAI